jgi:hypothetical protein
MIKLMASNANNINTVKTNKVVTWKAVILQALEEAREATTAAHLTNPMAKPIQPMISKHKDACKEAKCQNTTNQMIVGTKEGVIQALTKIIGGGILDAITKTPDGRDYSSIEDYTLHNVMQLAIKHALRPEVDNVLEMVKIWYGTKFNFRKSIHLNVQATKEAATRIAQFGLQINKPELTFVLLAEVHRATKYEWGREFRTAMSNIKKAYKYNHVHDATLFAAILKECALVDLAR